MPVTPFHYPIAKILQIVKLNLSLPALIVGAMVPDLEVPFVLLLANGQDRLVLHSLVGGLTLGTLIALAITAFLYTPLLSALLPIDKTKVKQKCKLSGVVVYSAMLGSLSHILLDIANHSYNPILWPFISGYLTPSPIIPLLGGEYLTSIIVHGAMLALFILIVWANRRSLWNHLLVE